MPSLRGAVTREAYKGGFRLRVNGPGGLSVGNPRRNSVESCGWASDPSLEGRHRIQRVDGKGKGSRFVLGSKQQHEWTAALDGDPWQLGPRSDISFLADPRRFFISVARLPQLRVHLYIYAGRDGNLPRCGRVFNTARRTQAHPKQNTGFAWVGFSWRPGIEKKAHSGRLSKEGRVVVSGTRRKRQIHRARHV